MKKQGQRESTVADNVIIAKATPIINNTQTTTNTKNTNLKSTTNQEVSTTPSKKEVIAVPMQVVPTNDLDQMMKDLGLDDPNEKIDPEKDIDDESLDRSVSSLLSGELSSDDEDDDLWEGASLGLVDRSSVSSSSSLSNRRRRRTPCCFCCSRYQFKPFKMGNSRILFPFLYRKFGVGILGPHVVGVSCTFILLLSASIYYLISAYMIGEMTFKISLTFTTISIMAFFNVIMRDPGFIHSRSKFGKKYATLIEDSENNNDDDMHDLTYYRFCGLCNVYQPPDACHCQDCGMCVMGYDHHCPWMGICIGKHNYRAFMFFNLTWFSWLVYALLWISIFSKLHVY